MDRDQRDAALQRWYRARLSERVRARGIDPYPARVKRDTDLRGALQTFVDWEAAGASGDAPHARVAGRVVAMRIMGRAAFLQADLP